MKAGPGSLPVLPTLCLEQRLVWSRLSMNFCWTEAEWNMKPVEMDETTTWWNTSLKKWFPGTSLVVWWLRICLPMQGVQVPSQFGELYVLTCRGAAKFEHCNWRACTLQLLRQCAQEPVLHNWRSLHVLQLEKTCVLQQEPGCRTNTQGSQKKKKKKKKRFSVLMEHKVDHGALSTCRFLDLSAGSWPRVSEMGLRNP